MALLNNDSTEYLANQSSFYAKTAKVYGLAIATFSGFLLASIVTALTSDGIKVMVVIVLGIIINIFVLYYTYKNNQARVVSSQYSHGEQGERAVREYLIKTLPDSYRLFPDIILPNNKGNIDFILTGPTGIFIIEVKNHNAGFVTVNGSELVSSHRTFERDFIRYINGCSLSLQNYIVNALSIQPPFITSVLVFSNPKTKVRSNLYLKGVNVVALKDLARFIQTRKLANSADILRIENLINQISIQQRLG